MLTSEGSEDISIPSEGSEDISIPSEGSEDISIPRPKTMFVRLISLKLRNCFQLINRIEPVLWQANLASLCSAIL